MVRRWMSVLFAAASFAAVPALGGAGITYHGRLVRPDHLPVTADTVQFRLQIRSPGTENCLMYQETHVLDLSGTSGVFAITINDGTAAIPNAEPFPLDHVFRNRGTFTFAAGKCAVGTTYAPNPADGRVLAVEFNDGSFSGWERLPAQSLNFVPLSLESLTVGGYTPSQLLRVHDAAGDPVAVAPLTQAQLDVLLDVADGTGGIAGNASGFTGALGGDVVGAQGATSVVKLRGRDIDTAPPGPGQVLKWNSVSSRWEPANDNDSGSPTGAASGDLSANYPNPTVAKLKGYGLDFPTAPAGGNVLRFDGSNWTAATLAVGDVTGLTALLGNKLDQSQMPAACAPHQTLSFISVTGAWSCTTIGSLNAGTVFGSGVVPAANLPASATLWQDGGAGKIHYPGGNVGVGAVNPAAKLDVAGEIKIGNSAAACTAALEGALRYNTATKRMEFCNGSAWNQISAGTVASVVVGPPSQSLVKSGPVTFLVTYGSATDTATINLTSAGISFSGGDFAGCAVTGVSNTSASTRTVTVDGCTGTGTVAISIAPGTATSTTGDPATAGGPSSPFNADNTGPAAPSVALGSVPANLSSSPTATYAAPADTGGAGVASYEAQVTRVSDGAVVSAWAAHVPGTAVTGLSLAPSTAYAVSVRAIDAVGNAGTPSAPQSWTSINGFVFNPVIAANTANYNVRAAAIAAGWDQVIPLIATVTINTGVVVYSNAALVPGFATGAFTAGSTFTLVNNGSILGWRSPSKGDRTTNRAWDGGPALQIDWPATIDNSGQIIGGSGSGGQGEGDSCGGCGGGNGGSYGGAGGAAIIFNASATITNTNAIYGAGGGGAGGGGAYAAGYMSGAGGHGQGAYLTNVNAAEGGSSGVSNGGAGGAYGLAGANGGNAGNGQGYGGAGGYAMVLNGNSVTLDGAAVTANSSYTTTTWLAGTKGRIAP